MQEGLSPNFELWQEAALWGCGHAKCTLPCLGTQKNGTEFYTDNTPAPVIAPIPPPRGAAVPTCLYNHAICPPARRPCPAPHCPAPMTPKLPLGSHRPSDVPDRMGNVEANARRAAPKASGIIHLPARSGIITHRWGHRRPNADDRGNGAPTFPVVIRKTAGQPFGRT